MGIFDLVLIASVLMSVLALLVVAGLAATGRFASAGRVLRAWIIYVAAYLAVVVVVSLFTRPRELPIGENACFDDWCLAVERIERGPAPSHTATVAFRLSSRARRISQRERYVSVYLLDGRGQRSEPRSPANAEPFDVLLAPGQTIHTLREFDLPGDASAARLVITHEGGFPIGWFIIGEGPFRKGIQLPIR